MREVGSRDSSYFFNVLICTVAPTVEAVVFRATNPSVNVDARAVLVRVCVAVNTFETLKRAEREAHVTERRLDEAKGPHVSGLLHRWRTPGAGEFGTSGVTAIAATLLKGGIDKPFAVRSYLVSPSRPAQMIGNLPLRTGTRLAVAKCLSGLISSDDPADALIAFSPEHNPIPEPWRLP